MAYLPGSAFQVAATTLAGQYLGANDLRRAVRSTWFAAAACSTLMSLIAVGFYFGDDWLATRFVGEGQDAIAQRAAMLVRIVAFGQLPQALLMVFSGALRGAGDTRYTLFATFIGYLASGSPWPTRWPGQPLYFISAAGSWRFPPPSASASAALNAMLADVIVRSLLIAGRFIQGGWKRIQV